MRHRTMVIALASFLALSGFLNIRFIRNHYITEKNAVGGAEAANQLALKTKQAKAKFYEEMGIDSNDIVFIGSSLTEGFPVTELFHNLHVKNRGISGGTMEDVKELLPHLLKGHPRKIFLEIGINDLKNAIANLPAAEAKLLADYRAIIAIIQAHHSSVYIQSLLPVNELYFHENTTVMNKAICEINANLKVLAAQYGYPFIDLYSSLGGANLPLQYTVDGLHLNEMGYKIWYENIVKFI